MGAKRLRLVLPLILVLLAPAAVRALSPGKTVAALLAQTGLPYTQVSGYADRWSITYTGLTNLDELKTYIWARQSGCATIYAEVFALRDEPSRQFLQRLLERNSDLAFFKYALRGERGSLMVVCQADLSLEGITAGSLTKHLADLVLTVDVDYNELNNLI